MPAPVLLGLAANRSRVYNSLAYGERSSLLALKAPGDHRGSSTPHRMMGSKDGRRGPSTAHGVGHNLPAIRAGCFPLNGEVNRPLPSGLPLSPAARISLGYVKPSQMLFRCA